MARKNNIETSEDDITIRRGETSVVIHGKALDDLFSFPPFFNAIVHTIIFVLFFFVLDWVGFPVLFTQQKMYWNITIVNAIVAVLLVGYLAWLVHRYLAYASMGKRKKKT